jgi:hypothetical protein
MGNVQGVLLLTRRELEGAQVLLQQIVDEQQGFGHTLDPEILLQTAVGDADDQAYLYATIRKTFERFGGADLIDRIRVKSFQAPDGNDGKYYVLFDAPV